MKGFGFTVSATLALGVSSVFASLKPVAVKGNAFYAGDDRFYVRGVAYQPGGSSKLVDPIADETICKRDIKKFAELGLNAVRIYSVDNSANHDVCMKALADAGIYLILDVNTPIYSINRQDPAPSYNEVYLQSIFATVDAFAKYDNTLAFFSGNEVINETTASTATAPYVKAVTRDIKQYIGNRGYRKIPVGYSAADVTSNRFETAEYMNCGSDDARGDLFAFNDYSWCDPSTYEKAGWNKKVDLFSKYNRPIFLSEYGCNTNTREWNEVAALYGPKMTPVYSGGLAYEYTQEANEYGLVTVKGNDVVERPDFRALKDALKKTPAPSGNGGARSDESPSTCPKKSSTWLPDTDALPAIPDGAVKYMTEGAGKGPGLKGNNGLGSQNAGTASTGTATAGSGTPSQTGSSSSSTSSGTAAGIRIPELSYAPFVCALIAGVSSALGFSLL